jgi:hypothetical protein
MVIIQSHADQLIHYLQRNIQTGVQIVLAQIFLGQTGEAIAFLREPHEDGHCVGHHAVYVKSQIRRVDGFFKSHVLLSVKQTRTEACKTFPRMSKDFRAKEPYSLEPLTAYLSFGKTANIFRPAPDQSA